MTHTLFFRSRMLAVGLIVFAALAGNVSAEEVKVKLSGDMEVPPVTTMAMGSGTITVMPDMTVSGSITTSGVVATAAHIHLGKMGANGPVAVGLVKNGDNGWMVPAGAKLSEDQYKAFKAGELYVNVHSAAHKGGEIRAQLMPAMTAK